MTAEVSEPLRARLRFEEGVVGAALFVAGLLGVVLGLAAPHVAGSEVAIGGLFVLLGARTLNSTHLRA